MDRSKLRRMACAVVVAACVGLSGSGAPLFGAPSAAGDPFGALGVTRTSTGDPAVAFDLKALDGATLGSQHLAGKVVLLNFWATWCGPCKEEMPSLARLQSQFDPEQVRVVTVTADIHPKGIKQFLDHLGIKLPVLFDERPGALPSLHGAWTPDHRADRSGRSRARPGRRAPSLGQPRIDRPGPTRPRTSTMKRWIAPIAIGMVVLYAVLAIGTSCCLLLHAEQQDHHHSPAHVAHSALCAWACQANPTITIQAGLPLGVSLLWSLYCGYTALHHRRASLPL